MRDQKLRKVFTLNFTSYRDRWLSNCIIDVVTRAHKLRSRHETKQIKDLLSFTEKPVFTIGSSGISDTDNFSDVSLDRDGVSDTASQQVEATSFYSPLAELDSMGNLQNASSAPPTLDLSQDQQQIDANLNPISAALAQLPNAASSVFSTFSSIIKGSGPHQEQQTAAPTLLQPFQEPVNPGNYAPNIDPNPPVPSFFSPTDDSLFKKLTVDPATNNTFRLGGNKKKTYAHIPGLSSNQHQQIAQPFTAPNPIMPPLPPQPVQQGPSSHFDNYQPSTATDMFTSQPREPEKSSKFSLTSLLPSQLLEKIPSTKNLFGSAEPTPSYDQTSFNQNEGFSVMTSNFDPTPQTNFFNPKTDASNGFIGIPQQQETQQQTSQQPVNFFNPQQFNTTPFAQHNVRPEPIVPTPPAEGIYTSMSMGPPPPQSFAPPLPVAPFPVPTYSGPINTTQSLVNEPAKIEAVSADTNCAPPTFFNPASEIFKTSLNDDGKPKNPYSSNRLSRGIGLHKTRPVHEASNVQPVAMPPMSEPANFFSQNAMQFQPEPPKLIAQNVAQLPQEFRSAQSNFPSQMFQPVTEQQKIPSRPPSIPPLPTGNFQQAPNYSNGNAPPLPGPPASDFFQSPQHTSFQPYPVSSATPPCADIFNQATSTPIKAAPTQPAESMQNAFQQDPQPNAPSVSSLFFDSARASMQPTQEEAAKPLVSKKSDLNVPENDNLSSASNFFQAPPSVPQFENSQSTIDSPTLNFFAPEAPQSLIVNDSESDKSTVTNFFTNVPPRNSVDYLKVNDDNQSVNSFNSMSVQASTYDNINDFTDKLDSLSMMSGNVGSTLSLFATSELDSSLAPKPMQFESLVPKFLDEQASSNIRSTVSPVPSLTKSYRSVYRHWFYQNLYWHPFAMSDSLALDEALASGAEVVVTDGGRFEVNLSERRRSSVYWSSGTKAVRRCSWFYKNPNGSETNLIPFDESAADFMENEYEKAMTNSTWGQRLQIPNTEDYLTFVDAANMEYHQLGQTLIVKRGVDEFVIDDGEDAPVDHLIISVSNFGDKIDDSGKRFLISINRFNLHKFSFTS